MIGQFKKLIGREISGAIDSVTDSISSITDSLGFALRGAGYNSNAEGLMYPLELRSQEDRPCIEFTAFDTSSGSVVQKTIWFPCPAGIAISDSASYNTIQLGALGGAVADIANETKQGAAAGEGVLGTIGGAIKGGGSAIAKQSGGVGEIAANAGQMAAGTMGQGDKVAFLRKKIMNPNSNTSFDGNPIRTYSFSFKMIARSQQESQAMKRICEIFQKYVYADSNGNTQNLTLRYPPVWRIRILDGQKIENQYLPKIYSCYLTGVSTTYNSAAATFHSDGAPLEVDVAINYQETRALTRYDIETMANDELRGISESGYATTQLSNAVEQAEEAKAAEEQVVQSQEQRVSGEDKTYTGSNRRKSRNSGKKNILQKQTLEEKTTTKTTRRVKGGGRRRNNRNQY